MRERRWIGYQEKPTRPISSSSTITDIDEARFRRLAAEWEEDTIMQSSLGKIAMHPSYQRIIGMGPAAIPLILREMKRKPGHWFWALDALTGGTSPAKGCKTVTEATEAWIRWGEEQELIQREAR
jgi:hypothetical protein